MTSNDDQLMNVKEAARFLQISERMLWQLTKDGEIVAVRVGRCVRYERQDVRAFIQRQKGRATTQ